MGFRGGADDPRGRGDPFVTGAARRPEEDHGAAEETDFPAVDIFETAVEIVVEAELPGIDPARVSVAVDRGALVVAGVKEEPAPGGRVAFLCMERSFGPFRRVVPLPVAVDLTRATAAYRAGVLRVRLPKIEEKRGRRRSIPVTVEPETP